MAARTKADGEIAQKRNPSSVPVARSQESRQGIFERNDWWKNTAKTESLIENLLVTMRKSLIKFYEASPNIIFDCIIVNGISSLKYHFQRILVSAPQAIQERRFSDEHCDYL